MDDAALVEAARAGDGGAWAAIYDRYADRLHDHCHRILRDRDEAADALHDAFISASRHLDQLRDPARLRPWLYSICRHEALRRARRRDRIELTPEVGEVTGVDAEMDRGTRSAELQELVWAAAAGLNPRDQALLDLNLRQGLEGQDLADAMGTSLSNSYVMLSRLRDQVERSLGSLLIARLGREDCDELDRLLSGWDGRFSPLLRKRVARHVDGCDVCRERRSVVASPMALLAAAPLVPAPSMLRDRVLSGIGSDTPAPPVRFTRGGFAAIETTRRSPGPRRLAAAAVVVLIALVAGVLAVTSGDDGEVPVAAIAASTTSTTVEAITTTTTLAETTTTTQSTTTTTTAPAVATPTTQPAAPPSTEDPGVTPPPPDTTPPSISSLASQYAAIYATYPGCSTRPKQTRITATIGGATAAVLRWTGPVPAGSKPMSASGSTWSAVLGPFEQTFGGVITYTVAATDAAGNTATRSRTIDLQGCAP